MNGREPLEYGVAVAGGLQDSPTNFGFGASDVEAQAGAFWPDHPPFSEVFGPRLPPARDWAERSAPF